MQTQATRKHEEHFISFPKRRLRGHHINALTLAADIAAMCCHAGSRLGGVRGGPTAAPQPRHTLAFEIQEGCQR